MILAINRDGRGPRRELTSSIRWIHPTLHFAWARGIDKELAMVSDWKEPGFVIQHGNRYVDVQ
jgi:hypothetical protein